MSTSVSPAAQAQSSRPQTSQEIQAWMVSYLATRHGVSPAAIDQDKEFLDYGLDSAAALEMVGALEDHLGRKLSPSLPYEHPTLKLLSQALAAQR